ncbi:hypothetical protein [Aeromicrobium sp.]|uniref:hypothetical protein n=1 Tax=Aeromicrobium sp. TaxID=1871063 RepID=UPI0030C3F7F7
MHDPLRTTIDESHRELSDQIDEAAEAVHDHATSQAVVQKTDAFLIHACRHAYAVCDVILPAARKMLPDGERRVREYVRQVRRLEHSVAQTKHRLYGESHMAHLPWSQVWSGLGREFAQLLILEQAIVTDLAEVIGRQASMQLSGRLIVSEACGPTRPHPHSPHTGRLAPLSRIIWVRADRFWNAAEGRVVAGTIKAFKAPTRLAS